MSWFKVFCWFYLWFFIFNWFSSSLDSVTNVVFCDILCFLQIAPSRFQLIYRCLLSGHYVLNIHYFSTHLVSMNWVLDFGWGCTRLCIQFVYQCFLDSWSLIKNTSFKTVSMFFAWVDHPHTALAYSLVKKQCYSSYS